MIDTHGIATIALGCGKLHEVAGGGRPELTLRTPAVSEFLYCLRYASPFTQTQIRKNLLVVAGLPPPEYDALSEAEQKRIYIEVLEDMGYTFTEAPDDRTLTYPQQELLTFDTQYFIRPFPPATELYTDKELKAQLGYVEQLLGESGFGKMFHSVVLTNDPVCALEDVLEEDSPERYLRWYYRLRDFRRLLDYPAGCLFYHGAARFPVLVISPPSSESAGDTLEAIRMRVVHELAHYYLTFTLFLDGLVPQAEAILELAGKASALFILDLIEESYAHADTAQIIGSEYVSALPHPTELNDEMTPLSEGPDGEVGKWLRERMVRFFRSGIFDAVFPWAFSLRMHGAVEESRKLVDWMDSPFPAFALGLMEPMERIYKAATLETAGVFELVRVTEVPAHLAHVVTRRAFDTFVAANLKPLTSP